MICSMPKFCLIVCMYLLRPRVTYSFCGLMIDLQNVAQNNPLYMHTTKEYSITCVFVENEINKYLNEKERFFLRFFLLFLT